MSFRNVPPLLENLCNALLCGKILILYHPPCSSVTFFPYVIYFCELHLILFVTYFRRTKLVSLGKMLVDLGMTLMYSCIGVLGLTFVVRKQLSLSPLRESRANPASSLLSLLMLVYLGAQQPSPMWKLLQLLL